MGIGEVQRVNTQEGKNVTMRIIRMEEMIRVGAEWEGTRSLHIHRSLWSNFCLVPVSLGHISNQLGSVDVEAASFSEDDTDPISSWSQA